MTKFGVLIKTILLLLFGMGIFCGVAFAQSGVSTAGPARFSASGLVVDSLTHNPMPVVNVTIVGDKDAVITDKKGRFSFRTVEEGDTIEVKCLGYAPARVPATAFSSGKRVTVEMVPTSAELAEVVVTKKKKAKYSKKNNPAVDLLYRIRAASESTDPLRAPRYSFDKYEKIVLSLNEFDKSKAAWLSKQLQPIEDFIDTSKYTGSPVLNISVKEKVVSNLNTSSPRKRKEVVKGFRSVGIDEQFDQENIQIMLEDVLREVNVYSNDISLLQNRFVSPLSNIGADYYKYFLGDTITVDGHREVELIFVPHNPESFSFNGSLYVDIDSPDAFISKITMRTPKRVNINFVKNIFIEQHFERDDEGNRRKLYDNMAVELQLLPGVQGFYAERESNYGNFSYADSPDLYKYMPLDGNTFYAEGYDSRPNSYWKRNRMASLSERQSAVDDLNRRMNSNKILLWGRRFIQLLVTGYIPTGKPSKVDIGPVNTFISSNSIEGARFKIGGMTTAALSPHWFARAYGAYGTKDHRWKYHGEVEYSFSPKKKHSREFPIHSIMAEHTYDLDMISQHYLFTNQDNIFLSLKRKENNLGTYRSLSRLIYTFEHESGLTLSAGIKAEKQFATEWLPFIDGNGNAYKSFRQSALFAELTFSPGATFIQTANQRLPVNMDNWVFRLSHEWGPKGMFGADFTLNKTELSVQKRFWFSSFGYMDCIVKGGKMWSRVQYPALTWPNANLSYTIQPESYSLMNPMEFANDIYTSWDLTYWMNGLIFNRIPYVNSLKLREVLTFKGLWGHLSKMNNPDYHPELFRFPADSHVGTMRPMPYMEFSAGIDNIFSILRVDYVWRLSYLHTPDAPDSGIRVALHFSF